MAFPARRPPPFGRRGKDSVGAPARVAPWKRTLAQIAVGFSKNLWRLASINQVNITWRKETIDSLPAKLGRFDLVLCCLVLSHIRNFREAIAKLTAHVEPGGSLILSDFHPFCLLLGLRSYCYSGGRKILVPNFVHLPSDYITALLDVKMGITNFLEPANIPELPGIPTTLVIKATAKEK